MKTKKDKLIEQINAKKAIYNIALQTGKINIAQSIKEEIDELNKILNQQEEL